MSAWGILAILLAAVAVCCALVFMARICWHAHLHRVAAEYAGAHLRLRRRMQVLAGRRRDEYAWCGKAETMYGYVWFVATRTAGQPFHEERGWAPFRWAAERAMAGYRSGEE